MRDADRDAREGCRYAVPNGLSGVAAMERAVALLNETSDDERYFLGPGAILPAMDRVLPISYGTAVAATYLDRDRLVGSIAALERDLAAERERRERAESVLREALPLFAALANPSRQTIEEINPATARELHRRGVEASGRRGEEVTDERT